MSPSPAPSPPLPRPGARTRSDPRGSGWTAVAVLTLLVLSGLGLSWVGPPGHAGGAAVASDPVRAGAALTSTTVPARARGDTGSGASLLSTLSWVLRQTRSSGMHPQATNTTTLNLTGFIAGSTDILDQLTNSGMQFSMALPAMPENLTGVSESSLVICVAGEDVSSTVSALIGFIEINYLGATEGIPVYLLNNSGTSVIGVSSTLLQMDGKVHTFTMQDSHGPWWTFTVDGQLLNGKLPPIPGVSLTANGNGTDDLNASETSLSASIPIFTYLIPSNVTGVPFSVVHDAMELRVDTSTSFTNSTSADVLIDEGTGVAGNSEYPWIPPAELEFGGALPVLSTLTELWGTGPEPTIQLAERGLPSTVTTGEAVTFRAWANSSATTGLSTAALGVEDNGPGGSLKVDSESASGAFVLTYTASSGPSKDGLTLIANASGYVSAIWSQTETVQPAHFAVTPQWTALHVFAGSTTALPFWVNSSAAAGGGPLTPGSIGPLAPSVGSVANDTSAWAPGYYPILYKAPNWMHEATTEVQVKFEGPGFYLQVANVSLSIWPRPLSANLPPSRTVAPGASMEVALLANSNIGPFPSAPQAWWNLTTTPGGPGDPFSSAPSVAAKGASATVDFALAPTYVGPITFDLDLGGLGFNQTSATWTLDVVGTILLDLQTLPTNLTGGSAYVLEVQALGADGSPLANAALTWSVSSVFPQSNVGHFNTGTTQALGYTNGTGWASVTYDAPSVTQGLPIDLALIANATGYNSSTLVVATSVVPANPGLLGNATALASIGLLIALILAGIVATVVLSRRRRRGTGSAPASTSVAAAASALAVPSDAEGRAPIPPAAASGEELEPAPTPATSSVEPGSAPPTPTPAAPSAPVKVSRAATREPQAPAPAPVEGSRPVAAPPSPSASSRRLALVAEAQKLGRMVKEKREAGGDVGASALVLKELTGRLRAGDLDDAEAKLNELAASLLED